MTSARSDRFGWGLGALLLGAALGVSLLTRCAEPAHAQGYYGGGYTPPGGGAGVESDPVFTASGQTQADVLDDWATLGACTGVDEVPICTAAGTYGYQDAATFRATVSAQESGDVLDDLNTLGAPGSANLCFYSDGAGSFAYASCTAAGLALLDDATAGDQLTTLGAQAQADVLDDLATLGAATTDGEIIVATGAGAFAYESGATARASLGLGTAAVEDTGTAIGDVVLIEDVGGAVAGLPAIDGSQLTGISGGSVSGLSDTTITGPTDLDLLQYDNGTSRWVDRSLSESGVQAQADVLDDLATTGANSADSEFLVGTGAGALAWESGATARTSLGLGSAAVENVGTSTGDVVQLVDVGGSPGLPAVDGSNLTGISGGGGSTTYLDSGYIASAGSAYTGDVVVGDTGAFGGTWTITEGTAMNTGTGVWTAPATGVYLLTSSCASGANAQFEINGTVTHGIQDDWISTRSAVLDLSASDTVEFHCYHLANDTEGGTGAGGGRETEFFIASIGGVAGWAVSAVDTEAATGNSYLGKTVYVLAFDAGACPNATTKTVSTGLGANYFDVVLEARIVADTGGDVYFTGTYHGGSTVITARVDDANGEVDIISAGNFSAYDCVIWLTYTKT